VLAAALANAPANAARPLLDKGQWDRYFTLTARDVSPAWKPAVVRLATYSGAPVEFAVYQADPADVLVAGSATARPLETASRKPLARWSFAPPPGFRFGENDVTVPIGTREGFFVVEARRGDAAEQVWINHTRLGIVTKEGPLGLLVWFVDLRTGRSASGVRAEFLVGRQLQARQSDGNGLVEWRGATRPRFVLATSGASSAFVSLLPQSPLPSAIVSVRSDNGVVHAGGTLRLVGFARRRTGGGLRVASGEVHLSLSGAGRTLATSSAKLDQAGAFSADLPVPAGAAPGDYAVIAAAGAGVGAVSVHVDAADDTALSIGTNCPCAASRSVEIVVAAQRRGAVAPGVPVRVQILRAPHIAPPSNSDDVPPWGTTLLVDRTVRTGADGKARIALPVPSDGLASTYGVKATAAGASASARVAVPTASFALNVAPEVTAANPGETVGFEVRGYEAQSGAPRAGVPVLLRVSHGTSVSTRSLVLDTRGRAHADFGGLPLGTNLAIVEANEGGERALDAAAVTIAPGSLRAAAPPPADVRITPDRTRYKPQDKVSVRASVAGAAGDAFISIDGARTYAVHVAPVSGGNAQAALTLTDPQGDVRVFAAFVRDGAIVADAIPIAIDGPGHVRATELTLERSPLQPGEAAKVQVHDGPAVSSATFAIAVTDGLPSASSSFAQTPGVLQAGGTVSQFPASSAPQWHTFVQPAGSHASDIYSAERPRRIPTEPPTIGAATPVTHVWRIERTAAATIDVPLPAQRGTYLISLLKIDDEGEVGAAAIAVTVR
jgi:hypothetical protein